MRLRADHRRSFPIPGVAAAAGTVTALTDPLLFFFFLEPFFCVPMFLCIHSPQPGPVAHLWSSALGPQCLAFWLCLTAGGMKAQSLAWGWGSPEVAPLLAPPSVSCLPASCRFLQEHFHSTWPTRESRTWALLLRNPI